MFSDIDHKALINKWSDIEKKPHDIFRVVLDRHVDAYHRDDTVHNFLTFLKLFHVHKAKFERSVGAFIIFSDVSLMPYIIRKGE